MLMFFVRRGLDLENIFFEIFLLFLEFCGCVTKYFFEIFEAPFELFF